MRAPEQPPLEAKGDIDKAHQNGHLNQRADHPGEGLLGARSPDADAHGDRQFKVVAGGREGQGCGAGIAQAKEAAQQKARPHMIRK